MGSMRAGFDTYVVDVGQVSLRHPVSRKKQAPPGYSERRLNEETASTSAVVQEETGEMYKRRTEALQNVAFSPVKQVLMMSFMMYMTGTRLHFFSILTVINGIYSPLSAILRSKSSFKSIPGSKVDVVLPHIMFCMIHFGGLVFALYRMHLMGLFPTHVSDWLSLISSPGISEQSVGLL